MMSWSSSLADEDRSRPTLNRAAAGAEAELDRQRRELGIAVAVVAHALVVDAQLVEHAAEGAVQLPDGRIGLVPEMVEVVREEELGEAQPADVVGRVDVVVTHREAVVRADVDVAAHEELVVVDGARELIEAARIVAVLGLQAC